MYLFKTCQKARATVMLQQQENINKDRVFHLNSMKINYGNHTEY